MSDKGNDLISRCKLFNALAPVQTLGEAYGVIQGMETEDAEYVRHGHWIDIDTETYTWKIRCSRCGHERSMMSTGKTYPMYCENCGIRMDGKDGDDGKAD